jgi:polysaccharide biosynthesis protein PslG
MSILQVIIKLIVASALFLLMASACSQPEDDPGEIVFQPPSAPAIPSPSTAPTLDVKPTDYPQPSATPTATASPPTPPMTATPRPTITPTPTPVFPLYEGPPLQSENIGVQIHIHREDIRPILRHLQALGVGWVKVQVSWKLYQPYPDAYAEDRLAELDTLVEATVNNNIQVLLSVSKAPEWSRPTTELDGPPTDYALYRDFMAFLGNRYQGRVAAYELWNEPNLQREWNGAPLSAADLTRLIAAGAEGLRQSDPEAQIISAAPATTGINDGITAIDDRVYLRSMLEAGIGDVVDGIGVHPYGWANPPDSSYAAPDSSVPTHNNHPSFFFKDTLSDYKGLLAEFDVQDQLWVSEFGWGSFDQITDDDGDPTQPPPGVEFMNDVNEWEQAVYLLRALEMGQEDSSVGPMIIWNLNFGPLLGHEYSETGYSILRPDGSRRPAYRSLEHAKKA